MLLLGLQSKSQSLLKESFEEDSKNFMNHQSFILNLEVSDQCLGWGEEVEPFDCNWQLLVDVK